MTQRIRAAYLWRDNAEVIGTVHELGFLRDGDHVLDPTYEKGNWWKDWRPEKLTTNNRKVDSSDFRALPYADGSFDAVAFDPPYVAPGGRRTSTIQAMHEAYGMDEQTEISPGPGGLPDPMFRTPQQLQKIIDAGMTEMTRLVRPAATLDRGGIILVKCMSYVWGGRFHPGAELTWQHATNDLGLITVDRLIHVRKKAGPQPKTNRDGSTRVQRHAANNSSTLWVFRKPPVRRRRGQEESLPLD